MGLRKWVLWVLFSAIFTIIKGQSVSISGNTFICEGSSTTLSVNAQPSVGNCGSTVYMSNGTTTVNCGTAVCFYDSGGPNGDYDTYESYVRTFTSNNNTPITINFLSAYGESCCDYIYIYDGASTSSTLIHSGLLSTVNGTVFTSSGSSITVEFESDVSVQYDGWEAVVSCNGCNNYSYTWSNGSHASSITVSPTSTTTYSVTASSPTCGTAITSVTVNVQDCNNNDGCPSVSPAEQGTHLTTIVVDCEQTSVTLEANAVATALETNSYTVMSIPYNPPYSFTAGTRIFTDADDDTWGSVLNLPFGFCYYGNNYNQIVPGANSVATFNTSVANSSCAWSFSSSLPSSSLFSNTIFACYRDIYPNYYSGDGIYEGVLGSYPCRSYVLSFNNIALFDCYDVRTFSSMIVLYEGTNIIDIYLRDAPTCSDWNDGNGVIGIQNSSCSAATVPPGRNTGAWTAHNEAWRFIPNGGTPQYTITWYQGSDTTGPIVGYGDVITVSPPGTTDYTARLQYAACNGDNFDIVNTCHVIQDNAADPVVVTASPDFLCANAPTTITANAPGATSYAWNTGATSASFTARPNTDPTTYTVTVSYGNGCSSVGSVTVHLDREPPTINNTILEADALNNNCIFTIPNLAEQFRPLSSDNYTANSGLTITQSPAAGTVITAETTVTITVTDECGNSSQTQVIIHVNSPVTISLTQTGNILCYGDSDGVIAVAATSGTTPMTYLWHTGNSSNPFNNYTGSSANGLPADTYTITVTDAVGCQASTSYTVIYLNPEMVAGTLSSDQHICRGGTPTALSVTGCSGGYQSYYVWESSTDGVNFNTIAGANGTTYTPPTLQEDMYYRVSYVSDSCGTVVTNTVHIYIHDPSSSTINDDVCQNNAYTENGFNIPASATSTPGVLTDSLLVQNANGCDSIVYLNLTILPNTSSQETQTIVENQLPYTWNGVTFTGEGTQQAVLTAANGCDSVVTMTLIVLPNTTTEIDTTVCSNALPLTWNGMTFTEGGSQQLVLEAANGTDSIIIMTVHVIPAQTTTLRDDVCQHEPYSGHGFTVSADSTAEAGVLSLSHLLYTDMGCDSTIILLLTIHPVYDQLFDVVACDSMIWNGHIYHESGRYTQQFSSSHGCDSIVTKDVQVVNTALELLSLTDDFCENLSAVLQVNTELQNIQWSTGETTPQIEVHRAGVYVVTAHTAQCEAFERININGCPFYMYLPNAITPSATPGENDFFFIPDEIANQLETCEFTVFDRWGKIVYHSTDPHFRWDGTSKGKILSNYVFAYKLNVKVYGGGLYQYSGTITVL
ncbi:MAG: gliding motility-associated C-terminal domain-containing protein [Bacteroidales bacterium]|nr:gliding motility-associated C-terminal domain-containing protein [Bacteroidales bacterium]